MNTKEVSAQVVYDEVGEPMALVLGDRDPKMYTIESFKRSDYESFLGRVIGSNTK